MYSSSTPSLARLVLLALLVAVPVSAATFDDGKLDTAYFGSADLEFRQTDEIDYLWVKDGFSLDGRALRFEEWPAPDFQGPKADERDDDDHRLARQMNSEMHRLFRDEWNHVFDGVEMSYEDGDVVVTGRIVDVSTGNNVAKALVGWGAGAGNATVDLKVVDKASGDLLLAMHHRVVSGTNWSTTNSKFTKWVGKAAREAQKAGGWSALYGKGDRRKK